MNENKLKDFLEDNNINDYYFQTRYDNLKIHKEKYDDRFIILYSKKDSKGLKQEDYIVSGYYDTIDKILYNSGYEIRDLIPDDKSLPLKSFEKVFEELTEEIDNYITDYVVLNADEYRSLGLEKYNSLDKWRIEEYKSDVERAVISNDNPTIKMKGIGSAYNLRYDNEYYNKNIIAKYLSNPKQLIEEYATKFISESKEELGMNLLIYENKLRYLEDVKKNDNNDYDRVYTNKKLIDSLKDLDAKNINITINYDGKEITFKYELSNLLSSLKNAFYKGYEYGASYQKVRDFFDENDIKDERGYRESSFTFQNITSITYGKKILYVNDIPKQEKEIENDDFDLER